MYYLHPQRLRNFIICIDIWSLTSKSFLSFGKKFNYCHIIFVLCPTSKYKTPYYLLLPVGILYINSVYFIFFFTNIKISFKYQSKKIKKAGFLGPLIFILYEKWGADMGIIFRYLDYWGVVFGGGGYACAMNSCRLRSTFLSGLTDLKRTTNVEFIIVTAIIYERLLAKVIVKLQQNIPGELFVLVNHFSIYHPNNEHQNLCIQQHHLLSSILMQYHHSYHHQNQ